MVNVFIVDDHPLFIDGVKIALESESTIGVIDTALSANEALEKISSSTKIVLLDLLMPEVDGIECASLIKYRFPSVKIIILTCEIEPDKLNKAWNTNVDAILSKYCGKKELLDTIEDVLLGKRVIGSAVPNFSGYNSNQSESSEIQVTNRERQILSLLAKNYTRVEASEKLCISLDTVNFHCKKIFKKFKRNNIQDVINDARKAMIIS
jgi:DNA-binding NarL/FixJ family response regulator